MIRASLTAFGLVALLGLGACGDDDNPQSPTPDGAVLPDGAAQADAGAGQMFSVTIDNISMAHEHVASGAFNTPVGQSAPGPLTPGAAYEFSFSAPRGAALSLATMFVQSNDLFYAPDAKGISLYDSAGKPVSGDVTAMLKLWDAGTEADQEPGLGGDQAPRQAATNTGAADPKPTVRLAEDGFSNLPAVAEVLKLTLTPMSGSRFVARLENVSSGGTLKTSDGKSQAAPLAPGVWVVHTSDAPLFEAGKADPGQGLEALAEDGDPSGLAAALSSQSGLTSLLAPGVYAVHGAGSPLFVSGQADPGQGLEALAEDGDPSGLAMKLGGASGIHASGAFSTPLGESTAGPAGPGKAYSFSFSAPAGARLSFATMFVQSNDLFYAPDAMGLALFDSAGKPVSGDVTAMITLWDAGTEVNQEPGIGPDQAPRQAGVNTGAAEVGTVRPVSDGFSYPKVTDVIKVTVTPLP